MPRPRSRWEPLPSLRAIRERSTRAPGRRCFRPTRTRAEALSSRPTGASPGRSSPRPPFQETPSAISRCTRRTPTSACSHHLREGGTGRRGLPSHCSTLREGARRRRKRWVFGDVWVAVKRGQGIVKRIVIVGGGFAGVYAAQALERQLRRRDDWEISLFSRENYFVFQPMLPEVISGTIGLTDVVSPLRRLLRRTHVHVRDVESIDVQHQTVTAAPGFRQHPHVVKYDQLVLAPGTVTDFRG